MLRENVTQGMDGQGALKGRDPPYKTLEGEIQRGVVGVKDVDGTLSCGAAY